jgi:TetR/AcrR family transcriptional regulator, cholesterol catabolism regulator
MKQEQEIKDRVLEAARAKFFKFGFTRVTMDEISAAAGISKKTLYQLFADKESLVRSVMKMTMKEIESGVKAVMQDPGIDFEERLKRLMTFMGMKLSQIGETAINDLKNFSPGLWKEVEEFRRAKVLEHFGRNIEEGADKGVFRRDIDPEIITLIYITLIEKLISPELLSRLRYSPYELFEMILKVMFEGILTRSARSVKMGRGLLPGGKKTGGLS